MQLTLPGQSLLESSNVWLKSAIERNPGRWIQSLKRTGFSNIETWGFFDKGWQLCFSSTVRIRQMKSGGS
jgi:hypothetical protein